MDFFESILTGLKCLLFIDQAGSFWLTALAPS